MKWLQQSSLVTLHQKLSFPTGHILVGFVDHDHERNHWSIHSQLCPHLPLSARWYLHQGTARLYHPLGHDHLSLSHPLLSTHINWQLPLHGSITQETSTSNSSWKLPSSILTDTGLTVACSTHSQPSQRPTALILPRKAKPFRANTRHPTPVTRTKLQIPRVHKPSWNQNNSRHTRARKN